MDLEKERGQVRWSFINQDKRLEFYYRAPYGGLGVWLILMLRLHFCCRWIKRLLGDYGDTHGGVSECAFLESMALISGLLKRV